MTDANSNTTPPALDPQILSVATTIFVAVCGGGLTAVGITSATDQATVAHAVIGAVLLAIGAAATWWKARQHSPQAAIDAINKPANGLKVVREDVAAPPVTAPLPTK
jgi:hypothetical protein